MEKVQWNPINKKQNGHEQSKKEKSFTLPRRIKQDIETEKDGEKSFLHSVQEKKCPAGLAVAGATILLPSSVTPWSS